MGNSQRDSDGGRRCLRQFMMDDGGKLNPLPATTVKRPAWIKGGGNRLGGKGSFVGSCSPGLVLPLSDCFGLFVSSQV